MTQKPDETRALVDALVTDLEPVRVFPALGRALAVVLGVWGVAAAGAAALSWPPPDFGAALTGAPWVAVIVIALAAGGVAGALAALAGVVPGREDVEAAARRVAWGGIAVAVAVAGAATFVGVDRGATPMAKDLACFALGASVGLGPAITVVLLERRGFLRRPAESAMLALLGGFGLGGLAVQLVCHHPGARHVLCGHVLVPVVMVALGALPLAWGLRRLATRARDAAPPSSVR